jgi:hypothetical protein
MMEFEWDQLKAGTNQDKHGVSFDEAATVLGDFLADTFYDPDHSDEEDRYITIGMSGRGRLLMVAHTDRGSGLVRIISARTLTKTERKEYENGLG